MSRDEIEIFDLSRREKGEWMPPIGAMGGPPAHELYRDLVLHAGLRLLRDDSGAPWVEIQDGERRRAFPVPSLELRGALDRFRMRRNLRPVPEGDIDEFARVVEARVSDPDVALPAGATPEPAPPPVAVERSPAGTETGGPAPERTSWAVDELDHLMHEVDEIQGRAPDSAPHDPPFPAYHEYVHPAPLHSRLPHRWHASVSGAERRTSTEEARLPRYLRVLRELVENGAWIGTLSEISRRTGDDTEEVFATLLRYHTDIVGNDLVVAPVEVQEGWRWIVVDRGRARSDEAPAGSGP
jgi:hypothetical protein